MKIQAMQDLKAAKILELRAKVENQECQLGPNVIRKDDPELCLLQNELSAAVVQMCHRKAFTFPYLGPFLAK